MRTGVRPSAPSASEERWAGPFLGPKRRQEGGLGAGGWFYEGFCPPVREHRIGGKFAVAINVLFLGDFGDGFHFRLVLFHWPGPSLCPKRIRTCPDGEPMGLLAQRLACEFRHQRVRCRDEARQTCASLSIGCCMAAREKRPRRRMSSGLFSTNQKLQTDLLVVFERRAR